MRPAVVDIIGIGTFGAGVARGLSTVVHSGVSTISSLATTSITVIRSALIALLRIVEARLRELPRLFMGLSRGIMHTMARNPSVGLAMMVFWRELLFG